MSRDRAYDEDTFGQKSVAGGNVVKGAAPCIVGSTLIPCTEMAINSDSRIYYDRYDQILNLQTLSP
jgi:hypothetical protein